VRSQALQTPAHEPRGSGSTFTVVLQDFTVGAFASALTGIVLWAVLPRGAALARRLRTTDWDGQPLHDTWTITNDSPVPVQFTSVAWQGVETLEGDKLLWRELPPETSEIHGLDLTPEEEQLYYKVTDSLGRWRGFVLPPGDTLRATVMNNHDLRIKYRRAGWTGVFERREIKVHGGV
jgi:hypothetical protein